MGADDFVRNASFGVCIWGWEEVQTATAFFQFAKAMDLF